MEAVVVIPARFGSTRFPGKPLAQILGKPMIVWVLERAREIAGVGRVIVATDDERISEAVRRAGGEAVMTSPDCPTGSDRIHEATRDLTCDIVVNLQGDEPALNPQAVGRLVAMMMQDQSLQMSTLASPLSSMEEYEDPNVVKVVLGSCNRCLYFSRSPIPHLRGCALNEAPVYRHAGVYGFRKELLAEFTTWPQGRLERAESLEQLRALERGVEIRAIIADWPKVAIDTPADIVRAEAALSSLEKTVISDQ